MDTRIPNVSSKAAADQPKLLPCLISGRRILVLAGIATVGAGFALNWEWLTAIGVTPILLALLPCAAMCALGLCMNRMGSGGREKSCRPTATQPDRIDRK